ncbi:MAG: serine/threonine-protein kinase, partial [Verrucomicrobiota bacterium]
MSKARTIADQALRLLAGPGRDAYIDAACGKDPALRAEVEKRIAGSEADPLANPEEASALIHAALEASRGATRAEETGTVVGDYHCIEEIGRGGFGVVYRAEQQRPVRREVALKILKLGMDTEEIVRRFEAERQALALMDHPHIAHVYDAGATSTGRPYFVMELVRGPTLTEFCDSETLDLERRLRLFEDVCGAIQHAHQKGIIHRDIKPTNILVEQGEGKGGSKPMVKVIDFGIAKATQEELTEHTIHTRLEQFMGTPAYVSPEQAQLGGFDVDTRTDIYSLGVLLYEILTGRTPFDSRELLEAGYDEIRRRVCEEEPPRPSTRLSRLTEAEITGLATRRSTRPRVLQSGLSGDLDWIVMKCLEKERGRRYDTANSLLADLRRYARAEPISARPPSMVYRLRKYTQRYRTFVAAGAMVFLSLILATIVSSRQSVKAAAAREQALVALDEKNVMLSEMLTHNGLDAAVEGD